MGPMRTKLGFFAASFAAATLVAASPASAAGMDPTPERLVLQPPGLPPNSTCQTIAADPESAIRAGIAKPGDLSCRPDNQAYRNMIAELGFAIAPTAFHPARTTGLSGFAITFETSFTKINSNAVSTATDGTKTQYWHAGTQGSVDPNTKQFSIINNSPDSLLQVYSLKARKGLPFGFELTGDLGYLANTSLWVTGADIKWAVLEGFRTGALGYLPDIAVGGGVRTLAGSEKFYLTTVGIDAQISKPFALADSAVLTPYVGYQRLLIYGDSTVVNSSPNVDALQQCGYQGNDPVTGAPICKNKLSNGADNNGAFNNNITFNPVRVQRNRGIVGLAYRYEILYLAGQFLMDLTPPGAENNDLVGDRQWTMSFEAGVFF